MRRRLPSIEASAKYCCRRERAVGSAPINTSDKNNVVVNASARGNYFSDVLPTVLTPVPHEKGMGGMISVASPVHLDVAGIVRELAFILIAQVEGVSRLW